MDIIQSYLGEDLKASDLEAGEGAASIYPGPHGSIKRPYHAPCHSLDERDVFDQCLSTQEVYPGPLMQVVETDLGNKISGTNLDGDFKITRLQKRNDSGVQRTYQPPCESFDSTAVTGFGTGVG